MFGFKRSHSSQGFVYFQPLTVAKAFRKADLAGGVYVAAVAVAGIKGITLHPAEKGNFRSRCQRQHAVFKQYRAFRGHLPQNHDVF